MAKTHIQWTDMSWNFLRGCTIISLGCKNCYAMIMAHRFSCPGGAYEGLTEMGPNGPRWTGKVRVVEEKITDPLSVKRPQKWFVNSMSDLFHEDVPSEVIDKAFAVMALTPQHTYQILTKRPVRMREYLESEDRKMAVGYAADVISDSIPCGLLKEWPLSNVIVGVSVEDQKSADDRIPVAIVPLLDAGWNCMLSCEPLLGPIQFSKIPGFNRVNTPLYRLWVIVGGESGAKARECRVDWIRSLVEQCAHARVRCFVKQMGRNVVDRNDAGFDGNDGISWPAEIMNDNRIRPIETGYQGAPVQIQLKDAKGGDPEEWPERLRVREYPVTAT